MKNSDFFPELYSPSSESLEQIIIQDKDNSFSRLDVIKLICEFEAKLKNNYRIEPQDRVAICADNSALSVILVMTLVHMGAVFVPVSKDVNTQDFSEICATLNLKLTIFESNEIALRYGIDCKYKCTSIPKIQSESICDSPNFLEKKDLSPESMAYILLTSGSTGKPKPIGISYRNLLAFIANALHSFSFVKEDRFVSYSRLTFDLSMFDIFISQRIGSYLYVLSSPTETFNPYPTLVKLKISILLLVPSVSRLIETIYQNRNADANNLRNIFFCGEQLFYEDLGFWKQLSPHLKQLINLYGPTEATVAISYFDCLSSDDNEGPVPIGSPFSGQGFELIETTDRGICELILYGSQVSDFGYLNENEKSHFLHHHMGRSFLTGDLVRKENEKIFWHARIDNQIKVLGHRIDLDGLSERFYKASKIRNIFIYNLVERQLVCFVNQEAGDDRKIYEMMQKNLMSFEIPQRIIRIKEFPLNSHGKVSKQELLKIIQQGENNGFI